MDCIAKNAERDDVRRLFRIEVRECFLAMYQRHIRARADFFGAQDPDAWALHRVDVGRLSDRFPADSA